MSIKSDSTLSSAVSVSGIESVISVVESSSAVGGDRSSATLPPIDVIASKCLESNKDLVLETPGIYEGFEFRDGDACILVSDLVASQRHTLTLSRQAGNALLATHKYLLRRFRKLRDRVNDGLVMLGPEDPSIEDFRNTFKILYTSSVAFIQPHSNHY